MAETQLGKLDVLQMLPLERPVNLKYIEKVLLNKKETDYH